MDNNIEKKIKKEFKDRTISPDAKSWDLLNAKLDLESVKGRNKKLVFLTYAAVFIGLLFGLLLFINNYKSVPTTNRNLIVIKNSEVKTIESNEFKFVENTIKVVDAPNEKKPNKINIIKTVKKRKTIPNSIQKSVKRMKRTVSKNQIAKFTKSIDETISVYVNKNTNFNQTTNAETLANENEVVLSNGNVNDKASYNTLAHKVTIKTTTKMQSTNDDIEAMLAKELLSYVKKPALAFTISEDDLLKNNTETKREFQLRDQIKQILIAGVDTVDEFVTNNN
ncbi:MAG: hypothetical protein V3U80_06555 [Flavobacteriaceae bacterium]